MVGAGTDTTTLVVGAGATYAVEWAVWACEAAHPLVRSASIANSENLIYVFSFIL